MMVLMHQQISCAVPTALNMPGVLVLHEGVGAVRAVRFIVQATVQLHMCIQCDAMTARAHNA